MCQPPDGWRWQTGVIHKVVFRAQSMMAQRVSVGYTRFMKEPGVRIRIERELREKFVASCREQDRPTVLLIREFVCEHVPANQDTSSTAP